MARVEDVVQSAERVADRAAAGATLPRAVGVASVEDARGGQSVDEHEQRDRADDAHDHPDRIHAASIAPGRPLTGVPARPMGKVAPALPRSTRRPVPAALRRAATVAGLAAMLATVPFGGLAAAAEAAPVAAVTRLEPVADIGAGPSGGSGAAERELDVQPPPALAAGAVAGTLALGLVLAGPVVGAVAGLTVLSRPGAPGSPTPRRRRTGALG